MDYIDIFIYDKDRRWDDVEQRWIWKSELNGEDIKHYQKMIVALSETEKIMGEVDKVLKA